MARKPRIQHAIELSELPAPADDFESTIAGEFGRGGNIKLSLSRVTPGSGIDGSWIDDIPATEESIDDLRRYVRDEHGGGVYILRMKRDGKFAGQFRFSIEGAKKNTLNGQAAPAPAANENALERLLMRFEENQRQIISALTTRPQSDPFEMFSKVADLIKTTRSDAPQIGAEQLMQVWTKGVEAAQKSLELTKSAVTAGSETGLMDLAKSLIESLGPTVGQAMAQSIAQKNGATLPAGTNGGQAPAQLPDPARVLDDNLRQVMTLLSRKAAVNADVETYAEVALDELDPNLVPMILQDDILDKLSAPFPVITQHRAWFDALRAAMIRIIREQEGQGDSERGGSGGLPLGDS